MQKLVRSPKRAFPLFALNAVAMADGIIFEFHSYRKLLWDATVCWNEIIKNSGVGMKLMENANVKTVALRGLAQLSIL